jgi:hypothetical protein
MARRPAVPDYRLQNARNRVEALEYERDHQDEFEHRHDSRPSTCDCGEGSSTLAISPPTVPRIALCARRRAWWIVYAVVV